MNITCRKSALVPGNIAAYMCIKSVLHTYGESSFVYWALILLATILGEDKFGDNWLHPKISPLLKIPPKDIKNYIERTYDLSHPVRNIIEAPYSSLSEKQNKFLEDTLVKYGSKLPNINLVLLIDRILPNLRRT